MDLSSGLREALHDPAVDLAVTLFYACLDKRDDNVIGDHLTLMNAFRYHHG